jgi:predicted nucleotidyltransferase
MDLETILDGVKEVIPTKRNIYSVLLRGSAAIGNYIPGKSDIDLTVVLREFNFSDVSSISQSLYNLSENMGVRIGVTFTDEEELNLDEESKIHYHGTKNADYTREIGENSVILMGEDVRKQFLKYQKFDISTIYFDASKKLAVLIKNFTKDPRASYKKGINHSFILAKQILHINAVHEIDKDKIVEKIGEIDEKMGVLLNDFYQDSQNWMSVTVDSSKTQNMFDYLLTCKQYIGGLIADESKKI